MMIQDAPRPDDDLVALGLPRAKRYMRIPPRHDRYLASWSIFAFDPTTDAQHTFVSLAMLLYRLQHDGLIQEVTIERGCADDILLEAEWRYTRRGHRRLLAAFPDE